MLCTCWGRLAAESLATRQHVRFANPYPGMCAQGGGEAAAVGPRSGPQGAAASPCEHCRAAVLAVRTAADSAAQKVLAAAWLMGMRMLEQLWSQ